MKITTLVGLTLGAATLALPARADAPLSEALTAFRAGEYARVLELTRAVAPEHEDHPKALYLAGETQLLLDDAAAAEASFRGVLAARPKAVPAQVGLGRALTARGDLVEARGALARALALEPEDVAGRRALGELETLAGNFVEARRILLEVFEASPADPASARSLVELLLSMDVAPDALQVAQDFAAAHPGGPMGPFLLALAHEKLGADEEAIRAYQTAIERDAKFLDAHKNLAILCHTLSDTYQIVERNRLAMRHYGIYFELGGKDAALRATYGQLETFLTPEGTFRSRPAQNG